MEEEEEEDMVESSQLPKEQRRRRRKKKRVEEMVEEAPTADNEDDTLQGNADWGSRVEEEEENEAATAAANLEALTASEKEEEEVAAAIAAELREAEVAKAQAIAEAALLSASQSFIATSTPTHGKEGGKGDLPSSVESGSFILTPEMISCVSSLTSSINYDNSSINNNPDTANGAFGASPSLPSNHVAVIVTPAPVATAAAAAAAPPELLGAAAAAPSPPLHNLSARLQALGSAAISAYAGPTPKMAISRLPPKDTRNRSASMKRARGDESVDSDGDISNNAKRNLSVGRDGKDLPSISQRELVALLKQPGQQQQRQSRAQSRGGQKGGRGGL